MYIVKPAKTYLLTCPISAQPAVCKRPTRGEYLVFNSILRTRGRVRRGSSASITLGQPRERRSRSPTIEISDREAHCGIVSPRASRGRRSGLTRVGLGITESGGRRFYRSLSDETPAWLLPFQSPPSCLFSLIMVDHFGPTRRRLDREASRGFPLIEPPRSPDEHYIVRR